MKTNIKITKILVNIILVILILVLILYMISEIKKEKDINEDKNVLINSNNNEIILEQEKQYEKQRIAETYKGYKVCARLEIPVISLETDVLSNYSTNALNISVTKFWGVEPNDIGNCCIAGHNFKNKNMFRNLKDLNVGDKIFLTDRDVGKVEYEIFDIYKVLPEDVSCLEPITQNERELTLITCTIDSKKRIIVKAKESI